MLWHTHAHYFFAKPNSKHSFERKARGKQRRCGANLVSFSCDICKVRSWCSRQPLVTNAFGRAGQVPAWRSECDSVGNCVITRNTIAELIWFQGSNVAARQWLHLFLLVLSSSGGARLFLLTISRHAPNQRSATLFANTLVV